MINIRHAYVTIRDPKRGWVSEYPYEGERVAVGFNQVVTVYEPNLVKAIKATKIVHGISEAPHLSIVLRHLPYNSDSEYELRYLGSLLHRQMMEDYDYTKCRGKLFEECERRLRLIKRDSKKLLEWLLGYYCQDSFNVDHMSSSKIFELVSRCTQRHLHGKLLEGASAYTPLGAYYATKKVAEVYTWARNLYKLLYKEGRGIENIA